MSSRSGSAPLILKDIVFRGAEQHADAEVVTWQGGKRHVQTLGETVVRSEGLARGLTELGIKPGDRIATLMWNEHRASGSVSGRSLPWVPSSTH